MPFPKAVCANLLIIVEDSTCLEPYAIRCLALPPCLVPASVDPCQLGHGPHHVSDILVHLCHPAPAGHIGQDVYICHLHQLLQGLLVAFWHLVSLFQRVVPIHHHHNPSARSWLQCDLFQSHFVGAGGLFQSWGWGQGDAIWHHTAGS